MPRASIERANDERGASRLVDAVNTVSIEMELEAELASQLEGKLLDYARLYLKAELAQSVSRRAQRHTAALLLQARARGMAARATAWQILLAQRRVQQPAPMVDAFSRSSRSAGASELMRALIASIVAMIAIVVLRSTTAVRFVLQTSVFTSNGQIDLGMGSMLSAGLDRDRRAA